MGEVVKFSKPDRQAVAGGKTLCKSGFHRWRTVKERAFVVERGKLVKVERCTRCGRQRTRLT